MWQHQSVLPTLPFIFVAQVPSIAERERPGFIASLQFIIWVSPLLNVLFVSNSYNVNGRRLIMDFTQQANLIYPISFFMIVCKLNASRFPVTLANSVLLHSQRGVQDHGCKAKWKTLSWHKICTNIIIWATLLQSFPPILWWEFRSSSFSTFSSPEAFLFQTSASSGSLHKSWAY